MIFNKTVALHMVHFHNKWIGLFSPISWPARSPDLIIFMGISKAKSVSNWFPQQRSFKIKNNRSNGWHKWTYHWFILLVYHFYYILSDSSIDFPFRFLNSRIFLLVITFFSFSLLNRSNYRLFIRTSHKSGIGGEVDLSE